MNTPPDDLGFLFVWTTVFWGGAEYQPFKPWLSSHDQNRHPTLLSSESLVLDDSPGVRLSTHECQSPNIIPVKNQKYFTLLPNSYFFPPENTLIFQNLIMLTLSICMRTSLMERYCRCKVF